MSQDFENKAKQKGDEFTLTPRDAVWQRIEAELDGKKRRRIVGWWWSLPALLLLGFAVIYFTNDSLDKNNSSTDDSKNTIVKASPEKPAATNNSTQQQPENKTITEPTSTTDNTVAKASIQISSNTTNSTETINKHPGNKRIRQVAVVENTMVPPGQKSAEEGDTKHENTIAGATGHVPGNQNSVDQTAVLQSPGETNNAGSANAAIKMQAATNEENIEKIEALRDSATAPQASTASIIEKETIDSLAANPTTAKSGINEKSQPKKTSWYILAAAGSSSLSGRHLPIGTDRANLASDPLNSSIPTAVVTKAVPDKAGLSFGIAVQRRQQLSKRWQWHAALGWQYHQVKQYLGSRVDSNIFQSNAPSNFSSTYYYQPGSNVSVKGSSQRILLSNELSWQVLKNKSWWRAYAGVYTGFNVYNNYFIKDNNNRSFKNDALFKTWFFGLTPGTEFVLKNNWTIGLNAKLDLTKAYTALNDQNRFWNSWELRAGIPLFRK